MIRIERSMFFNSARPGRKTLVLALGLAAICLTACVHVHLPAATVAASAAARQQARIDFSSCKRPEWPEAELAARHLGTVVLEFLVGVDGKVQDSIITKTTGHPVLDDTARQAISKCTFTPAKENGKPVADWTEVKYVWAMH